MPQAAPHTTPSQARRRTSTRNRKRHKQADEQNDMAWQIAFSINKPCGACCCSITPTMPRHHQVPPHHPPSQVPSAASNQPSCDVLTAALLIQNVRSWPVWMPVPSIPPTPHPVALPLLALSPSPAPLSDLYLLLSPTEYGRALRACTAGAVHALLVLCMHRSCCTAQHSTTRAYYL
jgi:hypothetical protein